MSISRQPLEAHDAHLRPAHKDANASFREEVSAGLFSAPVKQAGEKHSVTDAHHQRTAHIENEHRLHDAHYQRTVHAARDHHPAKGDNLRAEHQNEFKLGIARHLSPSQLTKDGVFISKPLEGSVFPRKHHVNFIVLHSTETAQPADARRVINSWNNRGDHGRIHHPGSQFVVDRDGKIYSTCNPDKATIHVNDRLAHHGVKNDNAVGIEIVHAGHQQYTFAQKTSVMRLVTYLQDHYHVAENHIVTHGQIQPATRTDPVRFDITGFNERRRQFHHAAMAMENTHSRGNSSVV